MLVPHLAARKEEKHDRAEGRRQEKAHLINRGQGDAISGFQSWIRTIVSAFKVRCPTARRTGMNLVKVAGFEPTIPAPKAGALDQTKLHRDFVYHLYTKHF